MLIYLLRFYRDLDLYLLRLYMSLQNDLDLTKADTDTSLDLDS